ncbi:hypothetical protein [Bradyrhizobium sp.]|uniref:hypothetical protein n=1 Tax=Bradyrhizobium sp. TaxID=376 RepID=UPI0025C23EE3|nr:hypothetical protein [Bradyrhizobium sp.]
MAFADRREIARSRRRENLARAKELMAGTLLVALVAALAIRNAVPAEALAPAVVTILFVAGAVTAGFALVCRRDRLRTMWFDLAGSLTFIGIVLSVLIEPEQTIGLFGLSDQPE